MVNVFREEQPNSSGVIETSDNASTVCHPTGLLLHINLVCFYSSCHLPPCLQQQGEGRMMNCLGPFLFLIGITSCGLFFPASQSSLCLSGKGCFGHSIIDWA